MLTRDASYHMDQAKKELSDMKLLLDVKVETQVILQLLVEKGIVSREKVQAIREKVKSQPQYSVMYKYIEDNYNIVDYYEQNPEQHLRDLLKAKMEGKIT